MKEINAKVFTTRNGQQIVNIPKKIFGKVESVKIKVPKTCGDNSGWFK